MKGWRMRVVTWNLWWRFGPWEERRKTILAVLGDLQPDAIGLQEVWASGEDNLADWLARYLGMHWIWEPSRAPERWQRRLGDPTVGIGNAILSRWPIVSRDVAQLPAREDDDDGRLELFALVDAPRHLRRPGLRPTRSSRPGSSLRPASTTST